jgi:hypothetical protein
MVKVREGWTVIGVNELMFGTDPTPPPPSEATPEKMTVRPS